VAVPAVRVPGDLPKLLGDRADIRARRVLGHPEIHPGLGDDPSCRGQKPSYGLISRMISAVKAVTDEISAAEMAYFHRSRSRIRRSWSAAASAFLSSFAAISRTS